MLVGSHLGTRGAGDFEAGDVRPPAHDESARERKGTVIHLFLSSVVLTALAQVFLLVDESTVRRYKADLTDEIEPQVTELLSRAEKGLNVLLKKESMLQTKVRYDCSRLSMVAVVHTLMRKRRWRTRSKRRQRHARASSPRG